MVDWVVIIPAILIGAIFLLFVWNLTTKNRERRAGFAVQDERTERIQGKAGRITVLISSYFMLGLLFYIFINENLALGLPAPDTGWTLIITICFTTGVFEALRRYFSRKGEKA